MMGKAIPQDTSETKEMMFNTVVRKDKVETIKIDNPEDREWAINPSISTSGDTGNFFKGSSTFIVPAKGSANYEVIYCPKSMTQKVKKADSEDMEDKYH
jgi:hydrocephalus-inducing protein